MTTTRNPSRFFLPTLALALLVPTAAAQMTLRCTGDGGAVPGSTTIALSGTPNAPFLLIFATQEQTWQPIPGLQIDVDLTYLTVCLSSPLLFNSLDASGKATTQIPVPNLTSLYGRRIAMQSLELNPLGKVSNLLRISLQQPETFAPTFKPAAAPILTGQGFAQKDGSILLLGGSGAVAQRYDPNLEEFSITAVVPSGNVLATQTQLDDGTILVAGGIGPTGQPVKSAFVFDPATGQSTNLPDMARARAGHAAARLNNGRVLIVGGAESLDFANLPQFLAGILNSSEIYDPKNKTFSNGPALLEQKMFHSATLLGNGEVLVAGGLSVVPVANVPIVSPTAQTYTPSVGIFGFPRLMTPRMLHGAVALDNGRALLAGGLTIDFTKFLQTQNIQDLSVSSVADAVTYGGGLFGGFSPAMPLSKGRLLPAIAPLGGSKALIAGGFELNLSVGSFAFQALAESDLLDGSNITATGKLQYPRVGAVAVPLPDGSVLVTGGGPTESEIFQPK